MSWFNRHLNISLASAWVIANALALVGGIILPAGTAITAGSATLYALAGVVLIGSQVWYLRRKAQPLWELIWNITYIGALFILFSLEDNHRK